MLLPDVARHLVAISQNCLGSGRGWQKLAAQDYCHLVANHLRTGRADRAAATFKIDLEPLVRELSGFRVGGADVELGEQLAALAVKFDKVDRVTALAMARSAAAVVSKDLPERKSDLPYAMGRGSPSIVSI